jgi:RsiW-degrading membrane proteinase PrsW (M82 family)
VLLLSLSLAPGIAIILFFYNKDRYNREPLRLLFFSFCLGVLSTIPAVLLQLQLQPRLDMYYTNRTLAYYFFFAFVVVGFSEEFSKYIMLRWYAYKKQAFDEPLDGIIYSVMISMGFATLENVLYVNQHGFSTALARMFLSVPAHAAFAVLMGYHVGLAKMDSGRSFKHLTKGLLLAIFFHGAFDFFLFLQESEAVRKYVSAGMLFLCSMVIFWIAMKMSRIAVRLHHDHSRKIFEQENKLFN